MTRIHLIRHGQAQRGWGEDLDPPLAKAGVAQAEAIARHIDASLSKMRIFTSPMRRCRETAQPLAAFWRQAPQIAPAVSEIPTPDHAQLHSRTEWLRQVMQEKWQGLTHEHALRDWRQNLLAWLYARDGDCVVFSHFVAINTACGAALSDDRLLSYRPDYCSLWVFEIRDGTLALIRSGREMESKIL